MIVAMREEEEKESLLHVKDQDPGTKRVVTEMNVKDQIQGKGQPIVGQRTVTKSFKRTIFVRTNTETNTENNKETIHLPHSCSGKYSEERLHHRWIHTNRTFSIADFENVPKTGD